jgi:hypothetical protein
VVNDVAEAYGRHQLDPGVVRVCERMYLLLRIYSASACLEYTLEHTYMQEQDSCILRLCTRRVHVQ